MGHDETAPPRESTDSVGSSTPFIPIHQPPPPEIANRDDFETRAGGHLHGHHPHHQSTGGVLKVSVIAILCRGLAAAFGLAAGITFSNARHRRNEIEGLYTLIWLAFAWNVIPTILAAYKPFLSISLVLDGGRVINLGRGGEANIALGDGVGSSRRRSCRTCLFRSVWIDVPMTITLFVLNILVCVRWDYLFRTTLALNWVAIIFQVLATVLTASRELSRAHLRFEPVERREYIISVAQEG